MAPGHLADSIEQAGPRWREAATAWPTAAGWVDRHVLSLLAQVRQALGMPAGPADPPALIALIRLWAVVVVLNLADAALTIWQATVCPGFADLNPIIQAFIAAGQPGAIVLLKVAVLAFAGAVFLSWYTRPSAQWAARIVFGITLWVAVHWIVYLTGVLPAGIAS